MQGQIYKGRKWKTHWGMGINVSDWHGLNIKMLVGSIVRNWNTRFIIFNNRTTTIRMPAPHTLSSTQSKMFLRIHVQTTILIIPCNQLSLYFSNYHSPSRFKFILQKMTSLWIGSLVHDYPFIHAKQFLIIFFLWQEDLLWRSGLYYHNIPPCRTYWIPPCWIRGRGSHSWWMIMSPLSWLLRQKPIPMWRELFKNLVTSPSWRMTSRVWWPILTKVKCLPRTRSICTFPWCLWWLD